MNDPFVTDNGYMTLIVQNRLLRSNSIDYYSFQDPKCFIQKCKRRILLVFDVACLMWTLLWLMPRIRWHGRAGMPLYITSFLSELCQYTHSSAMFNNSLTGKSHLLIFDKLFLEVTETRFTSLYRVWKVYQILVTNSNRWLSSNGLRVGIVRRPWRPSQAEGMHYPAARRA